MRKMALPGSVSYSGAKSCNATFSASTNWRIGSLTFSSKICLRGKNHSRLLFFASPRKNCKASGGNPGKGEGKATSVFHVWNLLDIVQYAVLVAAVTTASGWPRPIRETGFLQQLQVPQSPAGYGPQ